jgi:hypothetical protein
MPSTRQPSVVNPGPGRLSAGQIPDSSSGGATADSEVGAKIFSTPVRTALVTAGGPVASINLGSNTFVGDVGSYPLDVLFSVVDQFDRAIFNAGTRVAVSSITGASVGDGFSAGAITLNLTPSIPTTTQYRVYYGARSTLSVLPVDALTTNRTYNLYADRVSYAGSPNWTTGSPLTAATVEAAIDAIVTDLAATAGGTRLGFAPTATWADSSSIAAGSLSGAINEILSDLGGTSGAARIGAAISGTWADTSGIAAATVAAAIGEVVTDLGGSSGGLRVGTTIASTWADATGISATSLSAAIAEVVSDLGGASGGLRVGTTISATWADTSGIASTDVRGAINEIVSDLGGTAGGTRIGFTSAAQWRDASVLAAGSVTAAIAEIVTELAGVSTGQGTTLIGNQALSYPARGAQSDFVTTQDVFSTLVNVANALVDRISYRQQDLIALENIRQTEMPNASRSDGAGGLCTSGGITYPVWVVIRATTTFDVSFDGVNYTNYAQGGGGANVFNLAYSPSLKMFVATGASSNIQTSTSGSTWTKRTIGGAFSGTLDRIIWSPSLAKFFIYAFSGGNLEVQHSTDGVTWTRVTGQAIPSTFVTVVTNADGSIILARTTSGTDKIWRSTDGIVFTDVTPVLTYEIQHLGVGYNYFFIAENDTISINQVHYSASGSSWTPYPGGLGMMPVAYSPEGFSIFTTGGENAHWFYSTDAISSASFQPLNVPLDMEYPQNEGFVGKSYLKRTSIGWLMYSDNNLNVYTASVMPLYDY